MRGFFALPPGLFSAPFGSLPLVQAWVALSAGLQLSLFHPAEVTSSEEGVALLGAAQL